MKQSFTDQLGRTIPVAFPPHRIVSIVPSQTELLFHLGLHEEIAGVTKFCVHPAALVKAKPLIGGTKKLNITKIEALRPDLIIGNKEENDEQQVKMLAEKFPVWMSDISNLKDACQMIKALGQLTNRSKQAMETLLEIQDAFSRLAASTVTKKISCAYLIWKNPIMAAANDTFIHSMLEVAGFRNVFAGAVRYPEVSLQQLKEHHPEVLLLSSEPFPFSQKHADEFKQALPGTAVLLVDGEMFSWYGSRLLKAPAYFLELQKQLSTDLIG